MPYMTLLNSVGDLSLIPLCKLRGNPTFTESRNHHFAQTTFEHKIPAQIGARQLWVLAVQKLDDAGPIGQTFGQQPLSCTGVPKEARSQLIGEKSFSRLFDFSVFTQARSLRPKGCKPIETLFYFNSVSASSCVAAARKYHWEA